MSLPLQSWVTGKGPQTQFHLSDVPPDVIVRDSSGHAFHLHKSMLVRHSNVFKARFDPQRPSGAAWNSPSDPTSGAPIITLPNELPDFTHAELNRLFHFMYMGTYSTGNRKSTMETQLIAHSRCFALGDRLDVPGLKVLAVRNFRALAAKENMKENASNELTKWPRVIESVFTLTTVTDLELRNAVVDVLAKYDVEALMANEDIQDVVERYHDLAVHMYRLMVDKWADICKDELRLKEFFIAKEAFSTEEEDKLIAEAKKSEGW